MAMTRRYNWRAGLEPNTEIGFWPGLLIVGAAGALAMAVGSFSHLKTNWEDALFLTVVLFGAMILVLRPAWRRWQLWRDLGVALAVHLFLVSVAVGILSANGRTLGGPFRTIAVLLWCVLLLDILWRRNGFAPR
jgi:hypothetical protein